MNRKLAVTALAIALVFGAGTAPAEAKAKKVRKARVVVSLVVTPAPTYMTDFYFPTIPPIVLGPFPTFEGVWAGPVFDEAAIASLREVVCGFGSVEAMSPEAMELCAGYVRG